ncbi:hypothetical protein Scep_012456 [Stephania cephalantha]|uniref:Uncharacterized protein n=1 Tax=Stephania cephalantha TaxID=152367 RepID=A0AAP0JF70_9MAGN
MSYIYVLVLLSFLGFPHLGILNYHGFRIIFKLYENDNIDQDMNLEEYRDERLTNT